MPSRAQTMPNQVPTMPNHAQTMPEPWTNHARTVPAKRALLGAGFRTPVPVWAPIRTDKQGPSLVATLGIQCIYIHPTATRRLRRLTFLRPRVRGLQNDMKPSKTFSAERSSADRESGVQQVSTTTSASLEVPSGTPSPRHGDGPLKREQVVLQAISRHRQLSSLALCSAPTPLSTVSPVLCNVDMIPPPTSVPAIANHAAVRCDGRSRERVPCAGVREVSI